MGNVSLLLGANISTNNDVITLDQHRYITDMLNKFNMESCHGVKIPAAKETDDGNDTLFDDTTLYKSLVGSLIYASTFTRPDIAFAVGKAGQAFDKPTEGDWKRAKKVLRYLKHTQEYSLVYRKSDDFKLIGYADADWGGDKRDRKSTSGFICLVGTSVVSWSCKKQQCVALSSTEAEYVSAAMATQELLYLRTLLAELGHEQAEATTLFQDNQGAIILASDTVTTKRSKHIDIKFHFIRDCVNQGILKTTYVNTKEMLADIMTKAVTREVLEHICGIIFN
jgi:hypothetical protein